MLIFRLEDLTVHHYPPLRWGFCSPGRSWYLAPDLEKAPLSLHFLLLSSGFLSVCGSVSPRRLDSLKERARGCPVPMSSIVHSTQHLVGAQDVLAKWVGGFCCCLPPTCSWIFPGGDTRFFDFSIPLIHKVDESVNPVILPWASPVPCFFHRRPTGWVPC